MKNFIKNTLKLSVTVYYLIAICKIAGINRDYLHTHMWPWYLIMGLTLIFVMGLFFIRGEKKSKKTLCQPSENLHKAIEESNYDKTLIYLIKN